MLIQKPIKFQHCHPEQCEGAKAVLYMNVLTYMNKSMMNVCVTCYQSYIGIR